MKASTGVSAIAAGFTAVCFIITSTSASSQEASEAQLSVAPASQPRAEAPVRNWQEQAKRNLRTVGDFKSNGKSLSDAEVAEAGKRLCTRINNYVCIKSIIRDPQTGSLRLVPWAGMAFPIADRAGHARFATGMFSARAALRQWRTSYNRDQRRSLYAFFANYATLGDGKNDPEKYSQDIATRVRHISNVSPHDTLQLYDSRGRPNALLKEIVRHMPGVEIGSIGKRRLAADAAASEHRGFVEDEKKKAAGLTN
jgi:hypothetical protein